MKQGRAKAEAPPGPAVMPANPAEVSMMRDDEGWSVFYRDDRYDLRQLYRGCGLEEASRVCEEYHETGQLSEASMPERYRRAGAAAQAVSPRLGASPALTDAGLLDAGQRRALQDRLSPHGLMLGECPVHDGIRFVVFRSDNGQPVSRQIRNRRGVEDWLAEAGKMLSSCEAHGLSPLSHDFVSRFASRLRSGIAQLRERKDRHKEALSRYEKLAGEDTRAGDPLGWCEVVDRERADAQKCRRHMARLARKLETLRSDPGSLFLPIGATVRLKNDMSFPKDWGLEGGHYGPSPVAGTRGVVVGTPSRGEWGVLVAFAEPFRDVDGTQWQPDGDSPIKIYFDAADLEVMDLGRFVDGRECRSVEFERTHVHDEYREDYGDMVVIAGDRPWRIMGFSLGKDEHWTDGQQRESLERMAFLTPLDEFMSSDPSDDTDPDPSL